MKRCDHVLAVVIFCRMASNLLIMYGLLMVTASLRPLRQYSAADSVSFMCYFSTPMLQFITIFMQFPQCFFYVIRFFCSSVLLQFDASLEIYLSIKVTIFLALLISSMAFSCFFISLRMAALFRKVWIISYFSPCCSSFRNRKASIFRAYDTALSAKLSFFFFLQMHAKLLNVIILMFPSDAAESTYLPTCGSINKSMTLFISFKSMFSFSSLKFSIVILLILRTKFTISCDRLKGTPLIEFLQKHSIAKWSNFYSFSKHSTVIYSPLCLWASMTFQIMTTTVAQLISLPY